jgi:hypothetical protein
MFATQRPLDGGIIYAETNVSHFFPEPFNGVTAAFFLFIAIYFTLITWSNFKANIFLTYCLGLIYIGGIGGTMYHTFRIWPMFRMMDWLPIMLLCLSAGIYFLARLMKWYWALITASSYIGFNLLLRQWVQGLNYFVNINYAMMALLVLLPVMIYLKKTNWKDGKWVAFALLAFVFALTFRIADKWEWLSIGTHFLWHIFGAVASFCMLNYIYLTQRKQDANSTAR